MIYNASFRLIQDRKSGCFLLAVRTALAILNESDNSHKSFFTTTGMDRIKLKLI